MPGECKIVVDCWRQRDKAINYSENQIVNNDKLQFRFENSIWQCMI